MPLPAFSYGAGLFRGPGLSCYLGIVPENRQTVKRALSVAQRGSGQG